MNKSNRVILIYAILLFVTLCIAYSNHFNNGFHFDDSHSVVDNIHIRNIKNIPAYFTDREMSSANPKHWGLRPIVTSTLAIDYWLGGGLDPFYFQLSTFLWFLILGVILFFTYKFFLKRSMSPIWGNYVALAAIGWFMLHTANAETINYIIARSDVLSTFFIVVSFFVFINWPNLRKWYLYIIPAIIGALAKETAVMLIVILFFYINIFEKELSIADHFRARNLKQVLNTIVKLLPLTIIVLSVQLYLLSKVDASDALSNSPLYYRLTQSYVWLHYFIAFFLPLNLSADTDWTIIYNIFDERIVIGLIFVVGLVVAIFKTSVKNETKPIAFGLIWFAAALLPTSVVPLTEITNDHRMFFPFIGLALSVVTFIGLWLFKNEKQISAKPLFRVLIIACLASVLTLNSYGTYQRNKVWKNEETLWLDVTRKSPMNGRGLMNYGLTQMNKGNYIVADNYFEKATQFLPNYSTLYINLGVLNGAINKPKEAEDNFKKAVLLDPLAFESYTFYARYLLQIGRSAEAIQLANKALTINPFATMALQTLMNAYNQLGNWGMLQQVATKTLSNLPNDVTAQKFLEAAQKKVPVTSTALAALNKPITAADYLNLSLNYYNQQQYQKCIDACKEALKLKPDYADAYSNMGAAFNMLQQWKNGALACNAALKINPNHKLAKGNLNWAQQNINK
jgi:tetratricopeptide (TPR) repeat protein